MQPGVSPMQDWDRVVATWKATLEAVERVGGYTTLEAARSAGIRHSKMWGLTVGGPASLSDIPRIETDLGIGLPPALSRFFLECSRSVDFRWQLPRDFLLPEQFRGLFCGGFSLCLRPCLSMSGAGLVASKPLPTRTTRMMLCGIRSLA